MTRRAGHADASSRGYPVTVPHSSGPAAAASDSDDHDLLVALLDGMDAALFAIDANGTVTHWNREAERILGWTAEEAVGRCGLAGWAVRDADAEEVTARLLGAMKAHGRQVDEFALLTKEGGRILVRVQSSVVHGADGGAAGVYCAFSEVHTQIDLERSVALSEALFGEASWGVVLVDADLRPALANAHAARALRTSRTALLGRPLGELLEQGVEDLEGALQHVLAAGAPPAPTDLWVTLRGDRGAPVPERRCWRSGFLRLATPLAEEPVPLGVAWLFLDVTKTRLAEQESARLRFRGSQLHRAGRAVAECEDPMEAAALYMDFALAGFADHALIDLLPAAETAPDGPIRLVRAAATPAGAPGQTPLPGGGLPVPYMDGHPALQAVERCGSVRAASDRTEDWAAARKWPDGTRHALSTALRSRGRTVGVVTFLRGASRRAFDRADAMYAEDIASRVAASVDLAGEVNP
ncbi:PAS domain-containing protein [Streptomyces morookaense]|uniref:PAS domain-containing protein n=1 Tax=Streptomyces morookaense TaxID=1970 RepID=UPI003F4D05DA